MSFYKTWRFWEAVIASTLSVPIAWLLGKVFGPIRDGIVAMGWDGFAAWFANLGWFLFVASWTGWFVWRRPLTATRIVAESTRSAPVGLTQAATDKPGLAVPPSPAKPREAKAMPPVPPPKKLVDELELTFQRRDDGLFAVVRNVNHNPPPKRDISLEVVDICCWSPERSVFFEVPEVNRAKKPILVRHSDGDTELYFQRKQRFRLFEATDNKSRIRFMYATPTNKDTVSLETIVLGEGIWLFRLRLKWGQLAEESEHFFQWKSASLIPEVVHDPRQPVVG